MESPGIYNLSMACQLRAHNGIARRKSTYRLRNTNAQKVKVANAGKLEKELFGKKVPDSVPRGANVVGNVRVAATRVDERLRQLSLQRDATAGARALNVFSAQEQLDDGALVDGAGRVLDARPRGLEEARDRSFVCQRRRRFYGADYGNHGHLRSCSRHSRL